MLGGLYAATPWAHTRIGACRSCCLLDCRAAASAAVNQLTQAAVLPSTQHTCLQRCTASLWCTKNHANTLLVHKKTWQHGCTASHTPVCVSNAVGGLDADSQRKKCRTKMGKTGDCPKPSGAAPSPGIAHVRHGRSRHHRHEGVRDRRWAHSTGVRQ